MSQSKKSRSPSWSRRLDRIGSGARNAVDLMRHGRLGAPYRAEFTVSFADATYRLRHYAPVSGAPPLSGPLLLVPPLMVTAEVYDISPELSAVGYLARAGVDVWCVDFGAPETEHGGMDRTLDDHVRAVADAVRRARAATGRDVHLAGYSQGGMFAYQAAALLRSEGIASLITFGSPVDIHRNIPRVRDAVAERLLHGVRGLITAPLEQVPGLPGMFTSTVFKMLSAKKEAQQIASFWANLHDREAITRTESRRRFLGGEGFVAWPGPALRQFVDEFIVNNRMASGGFVIDGQTLSLADIRSPILYFVGLRDELARPAAVRAIVTAAPRTTHDGVEVKAGHFGLVVGSTALRVTWPTVAEWVRWKEGAPDRPVAFSAAGTAALHDDEVEEGGFEAVDFRIGAVYDVATDAIDALWNRLGDVSKDVGELVDGMRWQLPRLARMRRLGPTTRASIALALAEQAKAIPRQTFFVWEGRAFTYFDANERVDNVAHGLIHHGVVPGQRVALVMKSRPSYLVAVAALNRIGAVGVLLGPDMPRIALGRALNLSGVDRVLCDPESAAQCRADFPGEVLVLGGGASRRVIDGVIDLEAVDLSTVRLPAWYAPNAGVGADLALIVFTSGDGSEEPRPVRITNRRWVIAALGAAASATLSTRDTVFTCLPMHHAMGMLVAVSGGLVGGARIAAAPRFTPSTFWEDVRRAGASVVFYSGEMMRMLLNAEPDEADGRHPVRLFAGSGLRSGDWERFAARFGSPTIHEFYASTEGPVVLVNTSSKSRHGVGRPVTDTAELAIVELADDRRSLARGTDGWARRVPAGRTGLLLGRLDSSRAFGAWDGFVDPELSSTRLLHDVFEHGDVWFSTGDLMHLDGDDFFFDGRKSDALAGVDGPLPTLPVTDALNDVSGVALAVAWVERARGAERVHAAVTLIEGAKVDSGALTAALIALDPARRPPVIYAVERMPLSSGLRIAVAAVREAVRGPDVRPTWIIDTTGTRWLAVTARNQERAIELADGGQSPIPRPRRSRTRSSS